MVALQTLTALLLLLTTTLALGPPPGSVGTLDFRYPDYIVEPLVDCPFEGVFPHPHDCTWYYRCYDRYGYGFYWRAYFQCEPGTVFSDLLDQCIWQGDNIGCANANVTTPPGQCQDSISDCKETKLCPQSDSGTGIIVTAEICLTTTRSCPGHSTVPLCQAGHVFDNTNKRCIEETTLCRPQQDRPTDSDVICEDQLTQCVDVTLCLEGRDPQLYRVCDIYKNCYHKQGYISSQKLCGEGLFFNALTNQCFTFNITMEDVCPASVTAHHWSDVPCVKETESCSVFTSCETREQFLGCSSFFVCGANAARSSVCSQDQVFVARYGSCIPLANMGVTERQVSGGAYSPCMFTGLTPPVVVPQLIPAPDIAPIPTPVIEPIPTPVITPIIAPVIEPISAPDIAPIPTPVITPIIAPVIEPIPAPIPPPVIAPTPAHTDIDTFINNYHCEVNGVRPDAEGHSLLGCSPRQYCNQFGAPVGAQVGCTAFYECQLHKGRLGLFQRRCHKGQFYFYGTVNACGDSSTFGLYECPIPNVAPLPPTTTTPTPDPPLPTPPPNPVDVTVNIVVTCHYEGEVPKMPENAARLHCANRALCSGGQFKGLQNTCEKYYHCVRDKDTGRLTPILRECDVPGQQLDLDTRVCITPQTNFCRYARISPYPGFDPLSQTRIGYYPEPLSGSPSQTAFGTNQANDIAYIPQTPQTWSQQSNAGVPYQNPSLFVEQTPITFNQQSSAPNTQFGILNRLDGNQQGPLGFNTPAAGGYVQQNPAPFGNQNRPIGFGHSNHL